MKKHAFTLAEVLITLGIIGIVAAMTLPSLVNRAKHKELEAKFQKQYSIISQAVNFLNVNDVCITTDCIPNGTYLLDEFSKIYKVNKRCDDMIGIPVEEYDKFCFPKSKTDTKYKNYNKKTNLHSSAFDDGQFYTMDGALVTFERRGSDKNVLISIDVNGREKSPNMLGHDLFMFQLMNKGSIGVLVPMGAEGTVFNETDFCSKTSTHSLNGAGCTAKALGEKDYFKNLP